ncbi:hypothetical protein [Azohydromonas sediminis]|uniref:hypothetical protein n=1 Tax=Azohydromonas sediminis TaxID=2259674 RepID=UPI001F478914|nr:hypothetical protein [Azohydromonas sediminis]
MSDVIVTHADMRALEYCNRGARQWFARHGLDWAAFITAGLPAAQLLATGDAMAHAVVEVARRRAAMQEP